MSGHLTEDDLDRLRSGHLSPDDVLPMTEHLAGCAACRTMSAGPAGENAANEFLSALDASAEDEGDHLEPETRLFPYVDGTLDRSLREEVEAHLAICELCREDVADLRSIEVARHPTRWPWIAAVAAAAAVAV